jgi:simple sugar transport system ATP-binding protein
MKVVELSGDSQPRSGDCRSLVQEPDLIIFDEGDARRRCRRSRRIHRTDQRLADEGKAVVVISSYLPESALSPIADESLHRSETTRCDRGS